MKNFIDLFDLIWFQLTVSLYLKESDDGLTGPQGWDSTKHLHWKIFSGY